MANPKTNAMRILDKEKINYVVYTYENKDGKIDGVSVAHKLNQDVNKVFKTLVTKGVSNEYYVFVIPVEKELSLKAAAKVVGEKSVDMIKVEEINKVTGYIRGGCSPVGMKRVYTTVIDKSCENFEAIIVSGGKIGCQIEINPKDLIELINGKTEEITQ
ncbi:Cys-tRNA(Pro) deacylase [Clostridium culturomicium]|uniref:Cys-tRNA(Pro) deacylase n=1 Tax=Clostridium culturomicium TaxID=1499683 RepID=UPI00058E9A35|nr:Cys-tRNA(Pro) deacylase [Clostridium culturomicium]